MRGKKILSGSGFLAIGLMATAGVSRGQITVNGTLDPSFGAPLALGAVPTSAGDATVGNTQGYANGSEIDATYATIQNNGSVPTLYVFFAGNINSANADSLWLFVQTGTGGRNNLDPDNLSGGGPANYLRMAGNNNGGWTGLGFDAAFSPNYVFNITSGGSGSSGNTQNGVFDIYTNMGNLNTGATSYLGHSNPGSIAGGGPANGLITGGTNPDNILVSWDNSNTAGVTATSVPNAAALEAITTGMELAIPLSTITEAGQSIAAGSTIELTGVMTPSNPGTIYNQITGEQPGYTNANYSTTDDTVSLGDPGWQPGPQLGVNDPGNQYVSLVVPTLSVPEPASIGLLALALPVLARRTRRALAR